MNELTICQIDDSVIIGFKFRLFLHQEPNTRRNRSTHFYNNGSFGIPFTSAF